MNIVQTLSIGALLYGVPKICSYCCTCPESETSRFDQYRKKMAAIPEFSQKILGNKAWFVISDVVSNNAWISFLAIRSLSQNHPLFTNASQSIQTTTAFFGFCIVSAFVRHGAHLFLQSS